MRPSNREIRSAAALIALGLAVSLLAVLSDELGFGEEAARGMFGWKQIALLAVGGVALASGAFVLARPWIMSRITSWQKASTPIGGSTRRWLMLVGLIVPLVLVASFGLSRLMDRLIGPGGGDVAVVSEEAVAPPSKPSRQDKFRAAVAKICERHQARLHRLAQRGYSSPTAARSRLLIANASALDAVRGELGRLDAPPEDADAYARYLDALKRIASAQRAVAAAVDAGSEERERLEIDRVLVVAEEGSNVASIELGVPACGFG